MQKKIWPKRRGLDQEVRLILTSLKELMKQKRVNYKDVASLLGVSESSVKRTFTKQKLDLEKITLICHYLGVSFFDLVKLASEKELDSHQYTEKQDQLLGKSMAHHYLFVLLLAGFTLSDIKTRMQLNEKDLFKLLNDLDRVGLIELHAENQVILKVRQPFKLVPKGNMEKIARVKLCETTIDRALTQVKTKPSDKSLIHYRSYYLSPALLEKLKSDVLALSWTYHQQMAYDVVKHGSDNVVPVVGFFFVDEFSSMRKLYEAERKN